MSFVTGLLASYVNTVMATDLISGEVNGVDHLIMKRRNGSTLDAGLITDVSALMTRVDALGPVSGDGIWHYVGGAGEPAFVAGVSNYAGGKQTVRFRKDRGIVTLDGAARTLITTTAQTLFVLPAGYRPPANVIWTGIGSMKSGAASAGTAHTHDMTVASCRITVDSSGNVLTNGPGLFNGNSIVSLSGLSFSLT